MENKPRFFIIVYVVFIKDTAQSVFGNEYYKIDNGGYPNLHKTQGAINMKYQGVNTSITITNIDEISESDYSDYTEK